MHIPSVSIEVPSCSHVSDDTSDIQTPEKTTSETEHSTTKLLTPEDIRPYPKAGPRKGNQRARTKGRTRILTSSPEKAAAEMQAKERMKKQTQGKIKTTLFAAKRKRKDSCSDSYCDDLVDSIEESDNDMDVNSSARDMKLEEVTWTQDKNKIEINDFVLVKFCTKKSILYYVGKVRSHEYDDGFDIQFMRKKETCSTFFFPEQEDISYVEKEDIILKLSSPVIFKGTERLKSLFTFKVDLSSYNVQ